MFAGVLVIISLIALSSVWRALNALHRMRLLTANFWKEQGFQTCYLLLAWLMLLAGGTGLFWGAAWAVWLTYWAVWLLFGFVVLSAIREVIRLLRMMRSGVFHRPRVSRFNLEILQRTGLSFITHQNINTFKLNEQDFFVFRPEISSQEDDSDEKLQTEDEFDGHIKKYFRKQLIANLINIALAGGLVWLTLVLL
jgi:hypothetical protein